MTRRFRAATAIGVALSVIVLAACDPPGGPLPSPSESTHQDLDDGVGITWPYGTPQDGKWADHPAVQALRASDLALAIAGNSHDWSAPELTQTTSQEFIEASFRGDRSQGRRLEDPDSTIPMRLDPGPEPRVILDVVEVSDTEYAVASCVPSGWSSEIIGDTDFNPQLSEPYVAYTRVVDVDGRYIADPNSYHLGVAGPDQIRDCTLEKLRYGYFDPAPDLTATYTEADVIPPTWLDD